MVDLSERNNGFWGREKGDRANIALLTKVRFSKKLIEHPVNLCLVVCKCHLRDNVIQDGHLEEIILFLTFLKSFQMGIPNIIIICILKK